jgi:hypothetical protein
MLPIVLSTGAIYQFGSSTHDLGTDPPPGLLIAIVDANKLG